MRVSCGNIGNSSCPMTAKNRNFNFNEHSLLNNLLSAIGIVSLNLKDHCFNNTSKVLSFTINIVPCLSPDGTKILSEISVQFFKSEEVIAPYL